MSRVAPCFERYVACAGKAGRRRLDDRNTGELRELSREALPRLPLIAIVDDNNPVEIVRKRLIGAKEPQKLLQMLVPVVPCRSQP